LVFYNNLTLLRCGYMCAGTLIHISRYLGKTSNNNNKRCHLCIHRMICQVCFHRVLHRISCLWSLLYYSCLHLLYHLSSIASVSCSYLITPWLFSTWHHLLYISTYFCMLVLTIRFSMHFYDSNLSIHVCLSMHATWHSHHQSLGSFDSPGSLCPGLRAWSVRILPVADLRGAAVVWISSRPSEVISFQASLRVSRVFLL